MSLTPASARRVEANRQNARKSTDPRTVEGKQRSSLNALRHGLASVSILAPRRGEDAWEFSRRLPSAHHRPPRAAPVWLRFPERSHQRTHKCNACNINGFVRYRKKAGE